MSIDLKKLGMLRLAVVTPALQVADVDFNLAAIKTTALEAGAQGASLCLYPELCLSGYTCGDLFFQPLLQQQVVEALLELARFSAGNIPALVVGVPLEQKGRLFNCAVLIADGVICGAVPKTFLPNRGEFYEQRWFASATERDSDHLLLAGEPIPFGEDLLFQADTTADLRIGIELCEDVWAVEPPSGSQALAGATLLLNLSASPEILGKRDYRRQLVAAQSARCLAAYAYASAGPNESSTDLVFSGHSLIAEYGQLLTETERFCFDSQLALADIDLQRLVGERQRNSSFTNASPQRSYRVIGFDLGSEKVDRLLRPLSRTPFVPASEQERSDRCQEIFALQTSGLSKRLRHTGSTKLVIGLSGGLDSTLALLVVIRAFDNLGLAREGIHALTMPGFGTSRRTRSNAEKLAELFGCSLRVIPIDAAVRQHFADIGHDEKVHDIAYENSQARERTQILMDVANQVGGLVIGTGDLSELALGWCTYNGDHMSMYGVNSGVPKTLVRYLVDWCAGHEFKGEVAEVLADVCATPVSPELLPPDEKGEIGQFTEEVVGPYLLHDFYLYHLVRLHYPPQKILALAEQAFAGDYTVAELRKWLLVFYRRFFSQQFKRSCLPDGPKIGTIALSPRGDWRMPSDASVALWIKQLEQPE